MEFGERVEDPADAFIQILQHPLVLGAVLGIEPVGILALDASVGRVLDGLVGVVHGSVRDVEKEWLVLFSLDEADAAVSDDVG